MAHAPVSARAPAVSSQVDQKPNLLQALRILGALGGGADNGLLGSAGTALRARAVGDPMGTLLGTVLGAATAFYVAERGRNPKVKSPFDALVFVSTSLSVGYSDIFPKTPMGKLVASAVMTLGPALSARALDAPERPSSAKGPTTNEALLESQRELTRSIDALVRALAREKQPPEAR